VNIRSWKAFVLENFKPDTPLFRVVAAEKDELEEEELAGRVEVWMKLVKLSLPPQQG